MIRAERLFYDFREDRALILDVVARALEPSQKLPIYVRAAKVQQLSANEYNATNAQITTSEFHTPHVATVVTAVFVAICGGLMPMSLVGELVSIGTLLAFMLVCIGVPVLRVTNPDAPRAFKVRAPFLVGPLGAAACLGVMSNLPPDTWLRLAVWLVIGFGVYFLYSQHHSKLAKAPAP